MSCHSRWAWRGVLCAALGLSLSQGAVAQAERPLRAGVVRVASHEIRDHPGSPGSALAPRPRQPADRAVRASTFVLGGAVLGAVVGGLLGADFEHGFCDAPATTCHGGVGAQEGIVMGAVVGGAIGWLVWRVGRSPRAG